MMISRTKQQFLVSFAHKSVYFSFSPLDKKCQICYNEDNKLGERCLCREK